METKKEKIVVSILIGIIVVLWSIQQYLTNQLYYQTPQYVKNQALSNKLIQENNQLKLELLLSESYTNIAHQAQREGYVPATFIYLNVCDGCALTSP